MKLVNFMSSLSANMTVIVLDKISRQGKDLLYLELPHQPPCGHVSKDNSRRE